MNDPYLTTREFDQFRADDREWKRQVDDRLDEVIRKLSPLGPQGVRITSLEASNSGATVASSKLIIGISAIVSAIINGIIASFSGGR